MVLYRKQNTRNVNPTEFSAQTPEFFLNGVSFRVYVFVSDTDGMDELLLELHLVSSFMREVCVCVLCVFGLSVRSLFPRMALSLELLQSSYGVQLKCAVKPVTGSTGKI